VLIHFDGWTDMYDYWTDFYHPDLIPCGWYAYIQEKHGIPYNKFERFDPPRGMDRRTFTWESYMDSIGASPVPFEIFTEVNFSLSLSRNLKIDNKSRFLKGTKMRYEQRIL
jgi:hypothetical protein